MTHRFADVTVTEGVKAAQEHYGSRLQNDRLQSIFFRTISSVREKLNSPRCSTFCLATVGETGWPYVQHRGGPPGFLRVIDPSRLAYADFRGNTQLVSVGNSSSNDRVSLILMDYPNRRRLKILGRMQVVNAQIASTDVLASVELPDYRARVERIVYIDVAAFDWNCPQHITQRYTQSEFEQRELLGD